MGTPLINQLPSATYPHLLKVTGSLSESLKDIEDGGGASSCLSLSTVAGKVFGQFTAHANASNVIPLVVKRGGSGDGSTNVAEWRDSDDAVLVAFTYNGGLTLSQALGLTYGGTGATTQAGAANAVLPSQATHNTKYLQTDGSNVSWAAAPSAAVSSVFGRTGVIVAAANDYAVADISGLSAALAAKQGLDAELTALAGLTSAADRLPYFTGSGTASLTNFTAAARNLLDDPDAVTQRATLGLTIGSNVQAYSVSLDALTTFGSIDASGVVAQTGAASFARRTITGTPNQVNVANGDGASGNPTLSLPQSIATGSRPSFGGLGLGTSSVSTQGLTVSLALGLNTDKGIVVKGGSSQVGNLQEWQNDSGSVLASVGASGNLSVGTISASTVLCRTLVEANTAGSGSPNVLVAAESRTLLTNEGATAENYHTLPSAAATYEFGFACVDADGIRVTAASGDTIRIGTLVSAAAGYVRSARVGSTLTLKSVNATEWVAVSWTGDWTVDGTSTHAMPAYLTADLNQPHQKLVGDPPPPSSPAWLPWAESLRAKRLANVPSERHATYYFSQAGNDTTGNGSESTPWKTLAKAQAILTASNGNVRLRFKGGETWRESPGLTCTKDNVTVDSYGTGKAYFTQFIRQYTTGWTNDTGDRWSRSEANPIGWVREGSDNAYPFDHIYSRQTSTGGVTSTPYSFYHTGSTLYINPGVGINPNSVSGGHEGAPYGNGWSFSGDNNRLENVELHGFGMGDTSTPNYGISLGSATDHYEYVCLGVDCFYAGYHAIGCSSLGPNYMWVERCRVGLCSRNTAGETVFVAFSANGGHECVWWDNEVCYGTLPDAGWSGTSRGLTYYVHTNVALQAALVLAVRTRLPNNSYQVSNATIGTQHAGGDLEAGIRGVIYGEEPEFAYAPDIGGMQSWGAALVNCKYTLPAWNSTPGTRTGAWSGYFECFLFNCEFTHDATAANNFGGGYSWFQGNGGPMNLRADNCRFNLTRPATEGFHIVYYYGTSGGACRIRNCIFTFLGTASGAVIAGHTDVDADNLVNCAYYMQDGDSTADLVSHTANPVLLTSSPDPVVGDSLLVGAGATVSLGFDARGVLRDHANPDIGPLVISGVIPSTVARLDQAAVFQSTLLCRTLVEANTAGSGTPNSLAATESRSLLTNEGATAENYHTLPTAVAGLHFDFACQDTDGVRVTAASGDTIRIGSTVSASAGYVKSTVIGSTLTLIAINATEWVAMSCSGTWTLDGTSTFAVPTGSKVALINVANTFTSLQTLASLASTPVSPSQITSNQNDYAGATGLVNRLSTDASRTLTGMAAGTSGEIRRIINVGSNNLVLAHQSSSSSAANRFICVASLDVTLYPGEWAELVYDGTDSRWRVA